MPFEDLLPHLELAASLLVVGILIWLLLPTRTYLIARSWLKTHHPKKMSEWIRYSTLKRQVTPRLIAMNATKNSQFSDDDLVHFNELFCKLGQQPAQKIFPVPGSKFAAQVMADLSGSEAGSHGKLEYVLSTEAFGVEWGGIILRKAEVVACTPDRLMIENLNESADRVAVVRQFRDYLLRRELINSKTELTSSAIQGFIDFAMIEDKARELFELLKRSHPDPVFSLVIPKVGDPFSADTMTPKGGKMAGKNCRVVEVVHPGLIRKDDPRWRIKALVKIENYIRE
jgi:hypothetical protein